MKGYKCFYSESVYVKGFEKLGEQKAGYFPVTLHIQQY